MATQNPATPLVRTGVEADQLIKRPRIGETIIKAFLFMCGVLSIFTTLAIVYILFSESIVFFTRQQWENTNKTIALNVDAQMDVLPVTTIGTPINEGDTIRIGEEVMIVTALQPDGTLVVERGAQETTPATHREGLQIFRANTVTLLETITSTEWVPQLGKFGMWPLVLATMMTTAIAMLVALPVGLAAAIYLSEYASEGVRSTLKPILEILAGIPTVVFGYFALTFMTPLLRLIFGQSTVEIFNTASAGIVVGILIIPLVSSMSEDALHAVPDALREASYALGATKLETSLKVVVPAALSGITAAFVVAVSRAIGETMIVAIAAGAGPKNFAPGEDSLFGYILNPFVAAETITGHIVRISGGDISYQSIDYNSLFALGLLLFGMTFVLNILARRFVTKYREVYE